MNPFEALQTDAAYVRIPANKSAALRLLLELVQRGSTRWTAGTVHFAKAEALAVKFAARYGTRLTPTQRSRRKAQGSANAVLVMYPAGAQNPLILWWLLVSPGTGLVADVEQLQDCYQARQELVFPDADGCPQYVLDHTQRLRVQGGGRRWTWSMTAERLEAHRLRLQELVRLHGTSAQRIDDLQAHVDALVRMPMFHGVREQVKGLVFEARRVSAPSLAAKVRWPGQLPIMTKRLPVYRRPEPMLLPELVVRMAVVFAAATVPTAAPASVAAPAADRRE